MSIKYYALTQCNIYSSHDEIYAIFSDKEVADKKAAEFNEECKDKDMGVFVFEISDKYLNGFNDEDEKHTEITVVNTVPSVGDFEFFPTHATDVRKLVVDQCDPLGWIKKQTNTPKSLDLLRMDKRDLLNILRHAFTIGRNYGSAEDYDDEERDNDLISLIEDYCEKGYEGYGCDLGSKGFCGPECEDQSK